MTEPRAAPSRQASLRDRNLRLVLATVLAAATPPSRATVAATTGLTRSTVSRLADELVAGGLLDELERSPSAGRGRPGTPLVAGSGVAALGLQVNPDFLAARVIDLRGRVVAEELVATDLVDTDPREAFQQLGTLARRVSLAAGKGRHLAGCGLAVPGIVAAEDGRVLSAPNLGWSDVRVGRLLASQPLGGIDLHVVNEAELAARTVAESAPGRPGPYSDFFYVSGEVGIGGAAVVDGRAFGGRHGWAGEVGHVTVDPGGRACPCGSRGCLEQYAGKRAMLRMARLPEDAPMTVLLDRAAAGRAAAVRAVDAAAHALGVALAGAVNLLDIPTIVLGGHLAETADALRPVLTAELERRVLSARWRPPTVEVAGDDPAAGATGAAYRAFDGVLDRPQHWLAH